MGQIYSADQLPLRYLPTLLLLNLTEFVWPLAAAGFVVAIARFRSKSLEWQSLLPTLLWFIIPVLYVLVRRPAMYDGFRHSLFILPSIFVLAGIALDELFKRLNSIPVRAALTALVILPGIIGNIRLHPYEYAYFNQFVGGTGKAASHYETDYWSICYKEAIERLKSVAPEHSELFIGDKSLTLALHYSGDWINVLVHDKWHRPYPGAYVSYTARVNPSVQLMLGQNDNVVSIGREGALFCVIKLSK
jgi:hypothetical protein